MICDSFIFPNVSNDAWILCNMFQNISSFLSSEFNWFSSDNPCDWDSTDAIICNQDKRMTHLDMMIYGNDYRSTFTNHWIKLTLFPSNLKILQLHGCGFKGNVDFSRLPQSIEIVDLTANRFKPIWPSS